MDLHWMDAAPTHEERAALDSLLGPPTESDEPGEALEEHIVRGGRQAAEARRHLLLLLSMRFKATSVGSAKVL